MIKIPDKVRQGQDVKAAHFNQVISTLKTLSKQIDERTIVSSNDIAASRVPGGTSLRNKRKSRGGTSGDTLRFKFNGFVKKDNQWFVDMGVGCIMFNQIADVTALEQVDDAEGNPIRYCKPVFPTIEVDGDDVRIDDETKPMLPLEGREDGTVWLICADQKCRSEKDKERLLLTARGKVPRKPDVFKGEICVPLVDFDVETPEGDPSGNKTPKEVYVHWAADWQQPYLCDKGESDSTPDSWNDSESFPGSETSDDSQIGGSDSSLIGESLGSGSDDSDDEGDGDACKYALMAYWVNLPTCLTRLNPQDRLDCRPKKFDVNIDVKFFRSMNPAFGEKDCSGYMYSAELVGPGVRKYGAPAGGNNAYVWTSGGQGRKLLRYTLDPPRTCTVYSVVWKVIAYAQIESPFDDSDDEPFACCGKEYEGTDPVRSGSVTSGGPVKPTPKSCGCTTSC